MKKKCFIYVLAILALQNLIAQENLKEQENKVFKGEFVIDSAKNNEAYISNLSESIAAVKFDSFNKNTGTYFYKGSLSVHYISKKGIGGTGFNIGKDGTINNKDGEEVSAGYVEYVLNLEIKGSKINYVFSNFVHHGNGIIGNGGPLEGYPECGSEKIGGIPNWNLYKSQTDDEVKKVINRMEIYFGK